MDQGSFFTYILSCADGSLYTGWTTNLEKRLAAHNAGKASRYTRTRLPVIMVANWRFESKQAAMRYECQIKRLTRPEKLALIRRQGTN